MGDRIFVAATTVDVNATLKLFGGLSFVSIVVADHNHHRRHQHPPSPRLLLFTLIFDVGILTIFIFTICLGHLG
jgi:hypothetical protein